MIHRLLERQLKKITDSNGIIDKDALLHMVNQAYEEYDRSARLQTRATQLMSDELNELNATIRKESDKAIAESQKRFELAVEGSNDGIWDWNVGEDVLWFSARCKTMLGYAAEDMRHCTIASWYDLLTERDKEPAKKLIEEHLKWRMRGAATLRFNHTSGETRHIMFRATTVQDSAGQVIRLIGIHTDITDLMKMQEDLKNAKYLAESANIAKSEFLTNMSHELRTPMHAILGFSRQALKRIDRVQDEKLFTMINNVQISGDRLLHLLNVLLDLSKLEARKMEFDFVQDDLCKALNQTIAETQSLAESKQIRIEVNAGHAQTSIAYDYKSIVQVFINLLSNAIKFSPPESVITVTFEETVTASSEPALSCRVEDQGVGIPEGEEALIFDKFIQSSKTKSKVGGTGLGLAIVKEIIEAHNGTIKAENIVPNGACFNIILPYKNSIVGDLDDQ